MAVLSKAYPFREGIQPSISVISCPREPALLYLITLTPLIGPYQLTTLALISLSSTYFRDKAAKQQRLKALRLGPGLFRGRTSPSLLEVNLGFSPISNKSTVPEPEHDITSVTHLIPTLDQG